MFNPQVQQKQLSINQPSGERIALVSDVKMVDTVVQNVLSNAIKFTPDGSTVELSVASDRKQIEIVVADTGIGIPAEESLRPCFNPGRSTGDSERLAKEQDSACFSVKNLYKMRRQCWIESEVGKGTTCRFTLSDITTSESFFLAKIIRG